LIEYLGRRRFTPSIVELLDQLPSYFARNIDLALAARPNILIDQSVPETGEMGLADGLACLGFMLKPVVDPSVAFGL